MMPVSLHATARVAGTHDGHGGGAGRRRSPKRGKNGSTLPLENSMREEMKQRQLGQYAWPPNSRIFSSVPCVSVPKSTPSLSCSSCELALPAGFAFWQFQYL